MKSRLFPELPLVLVEWTDAAGDRDAEVDPSDAVSMSQFGGTMLTLEPGWLVKIDRQEVVCALSKWPSEKRGGHSNTIPLAMVTSVKGVDGTVYYERRRARKKVPVEG
jgi:hypothetical protein